jgi:hypothetical protein
MVNGELRTRDAFRWFNGVPLADAQQHEYPRSNRPDEVAMAGVRDMTLKYLLVRMGISGSWNDLRFSLVNRVFRRFPKLKGL